MKTGRWVWFWRWNGGMRYIAVSHEEPKWCDLIPRWLCRNTTLVCSHEASRQFNIPEKLLRSWTWPHGVWIETSHNCDAKFQTMLRDVEGEA